MDKAMWSPGTGRETLDSLLARVAEKAPDAEFLVSPDRSALSYADLQRLVLEFGEVLDKAGLQRGDRLALVLPNGPEMATAFLATASHICCAPLNPAYSATEFEFYLTDLRAKAVLLLAGDRSAARDVALSLGIQVLELSVDLDGPVGRFAVLGSEAGGAAVGARRAAEPDDVALVLHTSGTTGRPKIVPLTHLNLCSSALNVRDALGLTHNDRCLNVMPLFHIHGLVASVLSSLASGGSVACTPGFEPSAFFHWLKTLAPTWYSAVPTIHQAVLEASEHNGEALAQNSLRFIRSSSSALPPSVMRQLSEAFRVPVIEAYGMTEAAHQMASNPMCPGEQRPASVGLPAGPDIVVLGPDGAPLAPGQVGEIAIRGSNVTPGYDGDQEANRAAFAQDWFRTGDEGCFDSDGFLYLRGRLKEIINRGGEKVSPREIDDVLTGHPAVAQAAAFSLPHDSLGEDVAAAVVLKSDQTCAEAELRAFCFQHLADHKVPSRILFVDTIPKGASGKLQRFGLAEALADKLSAGYDAPKSQVENLIAELFAEVTGVERVGINDNFFTLGGDSIRGLQLVSRIQASLQVELSPVAVFRHPTVVLLAQEVNRAAEALFGESIEDLLSEIEAMSDAEAEALLSAMDADQNDSATGGCPPTANR